jgi:hypothetical protein
MCRNAAIGRKRSRAVDECFSRGFTRIKHGKNHDQEFGKRENRSNSRFRESYFYQSNGIICV